jgi:hypothetical protein
MTNGRSHASAKEKTGSACEIGAGENQDAHLVPCDVPGKTPVAGKQTHLRGPRNVNLFSPAGLERNHRHCQCSSDFFYKKIVPLTLAERLSV